MLVYYLDFHYYISSLCHQAFEPQSKERKKIQKKLQKLNKGTQSTYTLVTTYILATAAVTDSQTQSKITF